MCWCFSLFKSNNDHVSHDECCGCTICTCSCLSCSSGSCSCFSCPSNGECEKACIGCITFAWLGVIFLAMLAVIKEWFEIAFSFLVFIAIFCCIGPFIYMIVVLAGDDGNGCDDLRTKLILLGVFNLINFIFCLYLMIRYGIYDNKTQYVRYSRFTSIICHIMKRDFWVAFYLFFCIFEFVWAILSLGASRSGCSDRMITCFEVNLSFVMIYLIIGLIIFIVCVCIEADYNSDYRNGNSQYNQREWDPKSSIKVKSRRKMDGFGPWGKKRSQKDTFYEQQIQQQPYQEQPQNNNYNQQYQQNAHNPQQPQLNQQYQNNNYDNNYNQYPQQQNMNNQPQFQNQNYNQQPYNNPQPYNSPYANQQYPDPENQQNYNYPQQPQPQYQQQQPQYQQQQPQQQQQQQQQQQEPAKKKQSIKEKATGLFGKFGGKKKQTDAEQQQQMAQNQNQNQNNGQAFQQQPYYNK